MDIIVALCLRKPYTHTMGIKEYLALKAQSVSSFAEEIGCSPQTVYKYMYGTRFPNREMQRQIFQATQGLVTPNDWVGVSTDEE